MQLMSDAVTVLGSRHGLFMEPTARKASAIRFGLFPGEPIRFRAGVKLGDREIVFPLVAEGETFAFIDQRLTPTSMDLTGIDPETGTKVKLMVTGPFRPRDAQFSTTPVLDLRVSVSTLAGNFRWTPRSPVAEPCVLFLEIDGDDLTFGDASEDEIRWTFAAHRPTNRRKGDPKVDPPETFKSSITQNDALVAHVGTVVDRRIALPFAHGEKAELQASWCVWSPPGLDVYDQPAPFKYTEWFASLDDVVAWARANPEAIVENSLNVDGIFEQNNASRAVNNLMALTLHSWMANTWWTKPEASDRDWFTVWEGSCYYHSTVDVEYTQTPFYLTVWPELLGMALDTWPAFVTPGETVLGDRGKDTVLFMHDIGQITACDTTRYSHPMPVEENTNYVLMGYAYWRRSGDFGPLERHAEVIEQALEFVYRCDTTGNGVPDQGMANTIDDASPAVQFGKEQIYLAVKAMAAFEVGADILKRAGRADRVADFRAQAAKIRQVVAEKGWADDHFVTLLDSSTEGVTDAWSGKGYAGDRLPGWDAAHIYTTNGLTLLDMVGRDMGIDDARLKTDLRVATERCLDTYGCRHSSYTPRPEELSKGEGGTLHASRIGWVSMNMLRDISAFYRGVDLRWLADRYWEFQVVTNTQGPHLFFETFNGNNLMTYPRGVAMFGHFDALSGLRADWVTKKITVKPFDDQVCVPLLRFADWENGMVPSVEDGMVDWNGLEPEGFEIR